MKRRTFIAGAVIAPVPAITGAAGTDLDDPHRAWLVTWSDLRSAFNALPLGEDADLERQMDHFEKLLSTTPAKTIDGIAAQFEFAIEYDAFCHATPITRHLAATITQGFAGVS